MAARMLEGRVALVTGGSRGLGRAICGALVREGAAVAFNYSRSEEDARRALEELRSSGGRAWAFRASVLDKAAIDAMVRAIEAEAEGPSGRPTSRACGWHERPPAGRA